MYNYKMTIQYDGSRYKGWQRLGNEENTIQGKIENVLSRMLGQETEIIGCS
jgi:tRNA pseudouridine38-40 synthase